MTETTDDAIPMPPPVDAGCDPIGNRLRAPVRATIEVLFEEELAAYPGRIGGAGHNARTRVPLSSPRPAARRDDERASFSAQGKRPPITLVVWQGLSAEMTPA